MSVVLAGCKILLDGIFSPVLMSTPSTAQPRKPMETKMKNLTTQEIAGWVSYWNAAGMVAVDEIRAFDQVHHARKFCECMRVGVFLEVTDLQIWNAIRALREGGKVAA